jgi:hypothetical protein
MVGNESMVLDKQKEKGESLNQTRTLSSLDSELTAR